MRLSYVIIVALSAIFVSGCVSAPVNPSDVRKLASRMSKSYVKTFTVNRPYKQVVSTIKKRARVCLSKTVVVNYTSVDSRTGMRMRSEERIHYTPSMKRIEGGVTLALQTRAGGIAVVLNSGSEPKDGFYSFTADIKPAGKRKTQVTIYRVEPLKSLVKAIQNWAKGSNLGCPDMTKL